MLNSAVANHFLFLVIVSNYVIENPCSVRFFFNEKIFKIFKYLAVFKLVRNAFLVVQKFNFSLFKIIFFIGATLLAHFFGMKKVVVTLTGFSFRLLFII